MTAGRSLLRGGATPTGLRGGGPVGLMHGSGGGRDDTGRGARRGADAERGSAVAEFTLVAALVLALFLGVVQVALAQHVRTLLIDAAGEGARVAARADRGPEDAVARTRTLIAAALADRYADDVRAATVERDGVPVVEVTVTAPLPVVGLLGPAGLMTVHGHALEEAP